MRLFRVAGVEVRVHVLFLLLPAVAVVTGLKEGAAGVGLRLGLVGILAASVLAHEMGHALVARARGIRVGHVGLGFFGGVAWIGGADGRPVDPRDEWITALGGPAANLLLSGALLAAVTAGHGLPPLDVVAIAVDPLAAALAVNLLMGTANLLPVLPADGGRVLRGLLTRGAGGVRATRVVVTLGDATALSGLVWAFADPQWPRTAWLVAGAGLLAAVGRREMALAKAREGNEGGAGGTGDRPQAPAA